MFLSCFPPVFVAALILPVFAQSVAPVISPTALPPVIPGSDVTAVAKNVTDLCDDVPQTITDMLPDPKYCHIAYQAWRLAKNFVIILTFVVLFALFWTFKSAWYPTVYKLTCLQCHCGSPLNISFIGWCCSCCCYCFCGKHRPNFRLRVVVHESRHLYNENPISSQQCYVVVACGNNPTKTTSVATADRFEKGKPAIWNEPLDVIVMSSDNDVLIQVMNRDGGDEDNVVGSTQLDISSFLFDMHQVAESREEAPSGVLVYVDSAVWGHAGCQVVCWCTTRIPWRESCCSRARSMGACTSRCMPRSSAPSCLRCSRE